jgi:hypothetical protein
MRRIRIIPRRNERTPRALVALRVAGCKSQLARVVVSTSRMTLGARPEGGSGSAARAWGFIRQARPLASRGGSFNVSPASALKRCCVNRCFLQGDVRAAAPWRVTRPPSVGPIALVGPSPTGSVRVASPSAPPRVARGRLRAVSGLGRLTAPERAVAEQGTGRTGKSEFRALPVLRGLAPHRSPNDARPEKFRSKTEYSLRTGAADGRPTQRAGLPG